MRAKTRHLRHPDFLYGRIDTGGRNSFYPDHKYYKYHVNYDKAEISVREYGRIKLS